VKLLDSNVRISVLFAAVLITDNSIAGKTSSFVSQTEDKTTLAHLRALSYLSTVERIDCGSPE